MSARGMMGVSGRVPAFEFCLHIKDMELLDRVEREKTVANEVGELFLGVGPRIDDVRRHEDELQQ